MCGLAGAVVGNVTNIKFPSFIKDSFVAGSLRGMDSSGIAVIDSKEDVDFHKLPINGSIFIQDKRSKDIIDSVNKARTIAMTHTRAATVGKVNYSNAHPFYFNEVNSQGDIVREFIGCHNGTLTISGKNDFDTDSEWALDKIMNEGDEAFKSIRGAYCFTWWDSETGDELNIARNNDRDLYIAKLDNGGLVYASEAGMLAWLAERNGLKLKDHILQLVPGYRYVFNVKSPTEFKKVKLPEPTSIISPINNRTPYEYKTNVQLLEDIIEKVKREEVKALPAPANKSASVTPDEVQTARDYQLLGARGKFMSIAYDKNKDRCEGIFITKLTPSSEELEWDAVIPHYGGANSLPDTIAWDVNVIGAQDDGTSDKPMLICSKPVITLVANNTGRVVAH